MPIKISRSRTFAVVTESGGRLQILMLWRTVTGGGLNELCTARATDWDPGSRDKVVSLLVMAGLTVRSYDAEEKRWMDQSALYGVVGAPGARDGTWGLPSLEEFEQRYLSVV